MQLIRIVRLAYLAPDVIGGMVTHGYPTAMSMNNLIEIPTQPWRNQARLVFIGATTEGAFREVRQTGRLVKHCGS